MDEFGEYGDWSNPSRSWLVLWIIGEKEIRKITLIEEVFKRPVNASPTPYFEYNG